MGLLNRAARKAGAFIDGATSRMGDRASFSNLSSDAFAPRSSALQGAMFGAGAGALANPSDPGQGALMGAGIGAGGGLGISVGRQLASGMKGGLEAMMRQVPFEGPAFESAKRQILQEIEQETGSRVLVNAGMQARNADELHSILSRMTSGGMNMADTFGRDLL